MKIVFSLLFSVMLLPVLAQQPFEGTIRYQLYSSNIERKMDTAELLVHFGKNKMRINYERNGYGDREDVIVHIDSGKTYELLTYKNTYKIKKLFQRGALADHPKLTSLAGHPVAVTDLSEKGISTLVAALSRGQVLLYTATDLYYPVGDKYKSNVALSMIYDNKIVLGVTIIDQPFMSDSPDTIRIAAVSVVRKQLPASLFELPAGATLTEELAPPAAPSIIESDVEEVEAVPLADPSFPVPAHPGKLSPPKKENKKAPVKSPARKKSKE